MRVVGTAGSDYLLVGHEILNRGTIDEDKQEDTVQIRHQELGRDGRPDPNPQARTVTVIVRGIDTNQGPAEIDECVVDAVRGFDCISVEGRLGDDRLIAGFIPNSTDIPDTDIITHPAVTQLVLDGGSGDDRIVGTRFADVIRLGAGNDTATGYEEVDRFFELDNETHDVLIEARNLNFSLADWRLVVSGTDTIEGSVNEVEETIGLFEEFRLFGGAKENGFAINNFTKIAHLDGTEESDHYVVTLSGDLSGRQSRVYVRDSGTGSIDTDRVEIRGDITDDTIHLDADPSLQQLTRKQAGAFNLLYRPDRCGSKTDPKCAIPIGAHDDAADIQRKLNRFFTDNYNDGASSPVSDVTVTVSGSGTRFDPWLIDLEVADGRASESGATNKEGKLTPLQTSDTKIAVAEVARAMATRIEASMVNGLLGSKPDLDGMFSSPGNSTQMFSRIISAIEAMDNSGSATRFKLEGYSGHGFSDNDAVRYDLASGATSISELNEATTYYVKRFDEQYFGLRTAQNETPITVTAPAKLESHAFYSYEPFKLSYTFPDEPGRNHVTGDIIGTDAAQIEASLNALGQTLPSGKPDFKVAVRGGGILADPWIVDVLEGPQDVQGNFFLLRLIQGKNVVRAPQDQADAAATVRPSLSLQEPSQYQRVYYDRTAEQVAIHGSRGNDTFVSDDSMAAMIVHGDAGNDNFFIGRVLKTKRVKLPNIQELDLTDDGHAPNVDFNLKYKSESATINKAMTAEQIQTTLNSDIKAITVVVTPKQDDSGTVLSGKFMIEFIAPPVTGLHTLKATNLNGLDCPNCDDVIRRAGDEVDVIDGVDNATAGVSFNAEFYGGDGQDYFEVSHNVGTLKLFGEGGDDTFFLKALLVEKDVVGAGEADGGNLTVGAGDAQGATGKKDHDTLIDYIRNNRVEIYGGSGFDTLVVAGTAVADTFYIFTDNEGTQYLVRRRPETGKSGQY